MHQRAIAVMRNVSQADQTDQENLADPAHQTDPAQYRAYPQIGMVFLWRVTRRDENGWSAGRVNLLYHHKNEPIEYAKTALIENQWVRKARQFEAIKTFEWFAMGQIRAVYQRQDGTHIVEFHDMRYGQDPASLESLWPIRVTFSPTGPTAQIERVAHHRGSRFNDLAHRMWGEIWRP